MTSRLAATGRERAAAMEIEHLHYGKLVTSEKSSLSWSTDLAVGGLAALAAVAIALRADQRLPVGERHRLQSARPGRPWRAGPLVRSRNADHL